MSIESEKLPDISETLFEELKKEVGEELAAFSEQNHKPWVPGQTVNDDEIILGPIDDYSKKLFVLACEACEASDKAVAKARSILEKAQKGEEIKIEERRTIHKEYERYYWKRELIARLFQESILRAFPKLPVATKISIRHGWLAVEIIDNKRFQHRNNLKKAAEKRKN
jgi:hypothetical protein